MAVFSEEPSDSEEEGVASDMDIREEVEANKKKKKKVDFAKAAEKAAKEKDSAAHAFSGTGQPLDPEGPAAAAGSSAQGKSQFVFGRIPRNIKMHTTTHPPFPGPPGVPEGEDVQNDEEAGRGLSQGSAALQRLMRGQSRRILGEEEAMGFFDDNRRNNREVPSSSRAANAGYPRQSVCPMGNACFSQTSYTDEQ